MASGDVALDGYGDESGYHLQIAQGGSAWREVAILRPAGLDPSAWVGYQCLSGDGNFAAVTVLPASSVNLSQARDRGAFAFSVDLASGEVHPVASGVGLKYYSPGCGTGDDGVFTTDLGDQDASTVLTTADLATGAVRSSVTVAGQVTSAAPAVTGTVAVAGSSIVAVGTDGALQVLARVSGDAYELHPAADGGVDFLTTDQAGSTAVAHHLLAGAVTDLGTGPRTRLHMFAGRDGGAVLSGSATSDGPAASAAKVAVVDDGGLPQGASSSSLDGSVLIGATPGGTDQTTGQAPTSLVPTTGVTTLVPRASSSDPDAAAVSGADGSVVAAPSGTSVSTTSQVPTYVPPGVTPQSTQDVAPTPSAAGLHPGGDAAPAAYRLPSTGPSTTAVPAVLRRSTNPTAVGAFSVQAASTQTPTCAVAPGDVSKQVMQPSPAQVDWAAQMAEQGLLTGAASTRPANWQGLGFPAYSPSTDFPLIPLSHPAGTSSSTVPRVVFEAIMAQESNFNQASWHAPAGNAGDPLIADYYGAAGDIVSMNYAGADCGYGIAQVTDGMHAGDHSLSARGQVKVAVDYQDNIAAGLQILEGKWNQLYAAGITANNADPQDLENWYFAIWAYNGGVQPGSRYNSTGCTPGPSCTGPDGTWGLGWTNNPDNLDYPPSRAPFLQTSYADAAHPGNWPYQERVMGWMASPIVRYGSKAYAKPTYQGGQSWLQIPARASFCTLTDNHCDPQNTNTSNPGATHCMLDDFECWWHQPVTWIPNCATTCATSPYTVGSGSTEPTFANQNPPTCSVDHAKVATNAIVVDDESAPPANLQGCGTPNWSSGGSFTLTPGANAAGDPIGQIDMHQLGVGLGGHVWFSHTEDGTNPGLINTGTWTPTLPSLQYYTVKIHVPSIGATATNVVYTINPGGNATPWKIRVNQSFGSEQWATIGTFAMQNGGSVSLSNQSAVIQSAGQHAYNFDVAWDAVAFVPQGGTPGTPIGGPPTVQDEPKGSNPAWLQCGCAKRTAGDPVDTSTGYFGDTFTDLSIPGRGMPLNFTRSYAAATADPTGPNAALAKDGPFGYGWTDSYNLTAATDTTSGAVTITQEDGSRVPFTKNGSTFTPSAPRFDATLVASGSSYVFTRSGREIYTFDAATGHLTAETTLAGAHAAPAYSTALAYDGSGHLSTVTDPAGRKLTLTWTGSHITALADTAGRRIDYAYDSAGNLTDVYGVGTDRSAGLASNDRFQFSYVAGKHLVASMRTPKNYTSSSVTAAATTMTYDSADRVLTQKDPTGRATTFAYGPSSSPALSAGQTLVTDPGGHKTLDTYSGGLLTSETKGYGTADAGTWTYTYDPVSLGVSTASDPDGNLQTFSYDTHGNQIAASNALGYTTSSTYDDAGDLIESVDPMGVATVNVYDQAGHINTSSTATNTGGFTYGDLTSTTITQAGNVVESSTGNLGTAPARTTNFYYTDPAHPADLTKTVDPNNHASTATYDTFGDQVSSTDATGNTSKAGYNTGTGWVTSTVSGNGVAAGTTPGCTPPTTGCTTVTRNAYGQPLVTTDALGHTTKATYGGDGQQLTATDGNGKTTSTTYDQADRPTVSTAADGTTTKTDYNPDGTVADTIDGLGRKTTYSYDGQGRTVGTTDPDNRKSTITVDHAGRVTASTDALGRKVTPTSNAAGQITKLTYSDGVTPTVSYGYDADGRRTTLTDGTGTTSTTYDTFGQITATTNGAAATVNYGYDTAGNLTS
ncbi:RHS repeat-associated core domain-containing protein [Nakamurella flavida]